MKEEFKARLSAMPDAKKLAIAIYGESVAAYRYGVLADKAETEGHRDLFRSMQKEEQGHRAALERLADELFPDDEFVLTTADKDLVIVGTRLPEVTDDESFRSLMRFLHDTEKRTGEFYGVLRELMPSDKLGAFLQQMALECVRHGDALLAIEPR